ncbi:23S rRNA (adenine(2503)-C(2))-methyltransferase RlmN [Entomospira culicis]|uniref:23S rRNA (Adenine(2503)-C(2))-methyltransferase RlmN n=1 Tax=Entomospira culicis TaxID=2719989 RepID=A0A968KUE3_9SPIO|nr:23S rRNA (adenine(2503)-C(2))-methyltransferase RlmN [Entomospira culicis]NIZ18820.1 23S rRNA (adenine(2503)-C(2))-methyltransferase RlmN [Entomospira culicis]NIZ69035.1 23S rRNA (adenine(2503)-C(2))-methyltransferase RlmN [Entomospira culicis]WDI37623.1 23S rRNA (adenine(2503)-C(2))-methyltransferase RlmN [Entomospira culicis]WDI39251.1 23S rRNA (adenine(2503)-C(2))-methyltransferase RlmN [Entomospira culicis]
MKKINIDILQYNYAEIVELFASKYKKREYHAKAFWQQLYRQGTPHVMHLPEFAQNQAVAKRIAEEIPLDLPEASFVEEVEGNIKFRLTLADGNFCEGVVIAMSSYKSLCISSQVGCGRGCKFCATGQMGLTRNLTVQEIIAQYFFARFTLKQPIKNIVFMGMGEPMDNFDAVIKAIDILSDQRGIRIPTKFITISTVGEVAGLRKLEALMQADIDQENQRQAGTPAPTCYRNIKLAISLHAPTNALRSSIMPVNDRYPVEELKAVLQSIPIKRKYHDLFIEYTLIPNVNDNAQALAEYLKDLPCVVNLIAYNPVPNLTFTRPTIAQMEQFKRELESFGQVVRWRRSRADEILGACGQLGATSL